MTGSRRLGLYLLGPFAAGTVIALAALTGEPLHGTGQTLVNGLALTPAVLVHAHNRAATARTSTALLLTVLGGVAAYAFMAFGLAAGAASTLAVAFLIQAGVLSAAADLSTVAATYVLFRPRPIP